MSDALLERMEQIGFKWMELVEAGAADSAEARALAAEFQALDREWEGIEGHPEDGPADVGAALDVVEEPGDVPDRVLSTKPSHPWVVCTKPRHPWVVSRRSGRKRALGEFTKGQLAALLAIGFSLRESARLLRISRSTAQRALEEDARLQAESAGLAQRIYESSGPKLAQMDARKCS